MKTNQLIIGGAVLAVGLYLYSRSNKTSTTTAIEKEESSTNEEKPLMTNPAQGKPSKPLKNQTSTTKAKRKFAFKRLQPKNPIENAVSTSISVEDANFAFNGHTF